MTFVTVPFYCITIVDTAAAIRVPFTGRDKRLCFGVKARVSAELISPLIYVYGALVFALAQLSGRGGGPLKDGRCDLTCGGLNSEDLVEALNGKKEALNLNQLPTSLNGREAKAEG